MPLLEVEHLQKVYTARFGAVQVEALRDVNFTVEEGEYVAIMGESGSGKTTLLNILAALDKPTSGAVRLSGGDITKIKDSKMSQFRREHLGFVFQDFNLLDTFSLRDNIFLPLVLSHKGHAEMAARVECVTINMVWPPRLISPNMRSSFVVALESSAPVGSSASTISGFVISARATAARCFCPPETS